MSKAKPRISVNIVRYPTLNHGRVPTGVIELPEFLSGPPLLVCDQYGSHWVWKNGGYVKVPVAEGQFKPRRSSNAHV